MEVTINQDGNTAKCISGQQWNIHSIEIKKPEGLPSATYGTATSFFRAACPPGTVHNAAVIRDNTIIIKS